MLLIVAHHYVVNSGLIDVLKDGSVCVTSVSMLIFGAWGKTGINCFVLITGWFMCKSRFTMQKFLRLYFQIVFYAVLIYGIFCFTGYEVCSPITTLLKFFPVRSVADGFTSCFLIFYLLIPFINILIDNLNRRKHAALLLVLFIMYTVLPTFPAFNLSFNYVSWFTILYLIASYIRFYGLNIKLTHKRWGALTLALVLIASLSIIFMFHMYHVGRIGVFNPYFFVSDSNKIFALVLGVSSFMYFKDLKIPQSKIINAIGGITFGVLLIHANSDVMRHWLWFKTVDCLGHYSDSITLTLGYAIAAVLLIFISCSTIDWLRGKLIEPYLMSFMNRIVDSRISQAEHKTISRKTDQSI